MPSITRAGWARATRGAAAGAGAGAGVSCAPIVSITGVDGVDGLDSDMRVLSKGWCEGCGAGRVSSR
ncbi:hypothetical protein GCM10018779_26230 [Streptomyces griseocarneus]|nr:hypothetical protein GCM10018779_26230 [Streptomyces griseocarneus]